MELAERFLLDALAYLECALGVVCYMLLKLRGSPYGRYSSPGSAFGLPARAAWVMQELPSLALPLLACAGAGAPAERLNRWPNCILLAMFLVHYAQRTLVFPFLIRGGKPTPLYVFLLAFVFCTYNGYLQSRYLSQYAVYADDWLRDPRFLTGSALWLIGMLINIHSDHVLRNLRKPGETGYKIPRVLLQIARLQLEAEFLFVNAPNSAEINDNNDICSVLPDVSQEPPLWKAVESLL
ncbi:3-oxo-5-alpha-steroid 4-dehydrogenase 1 isoform X4 [Odocoileus virginianus]|uniref:3-oxo-5-alpha-steroid 4-dehydrogenase 1 isoform X4 n=1 Tax=Odocoileus virginianus TaxID=9874 RepID=A0ABM4IXL3_ODOVR